MELSDREQREQAAGDLDTCFLVEAAAGTGKTTLMSQRMVNLVESGRCRPEHLVAVTFTRKAASELKLRFMSQVKEKVAAGEAVQPLREAAANLNAVFVGTIHSFCARLLRERPIEAEVDPAFEEIEPEQDQELRKAVFQRVVTEMFESGDQIIRDMHELALDPMSLQGEFLRFCDYPDVEVWPAEQAPSPVSALVQVVAQVREYVERVEAMLHLVPLEQSGCALARRYRFMCRRFRQIEEMDWLEDFGRMHDYLSALLRKARPLKRAWQQLCGQEGKRLVEDEEERYEHFRSNVLQPWFDGLCWARYRPFLDLMKKVWEEYEREKRRLGLLNYQDLLMKARALLLHSSEVLGYFQARFTHLLVDEFQDTDPIQAEVILRLVSQGIPNDRMDGARPRPGSLFLVGDPKQSIYRFRRADIVTYNQVKEIIRSTGGRVIHLSSNFRSERPIIEWVNNTFQGMFEKEATEFSPAYVPLAAPPNKRTSMISQPGVYRIEVSKTRSKVESVRREARVVARMIRHMAASNPNLSWSSFMLISARKSYMSEYGKALEEQAVPYWLAGGGSLAELPEFKLLHLCLKAVLNPEDGYSLVLLLRSELFGFSDLDLYEFKQAGGEFDYRKALPRGLDGDLADRFGQAFKILQDSYVHLDQSSPVAGLRKVMDGVGLFGRCAAAGGFGDMRIGGLLKVLELARQAESSGTGSAGLLELMERLEDAEHDYGPAAALDRPRVRIMNLHKAKGLQAEVVFLVGCHGTGNRSIKLHVDRSGGHVRGYMAAGGDYYPTAHPNIECWRKYKEREEAFLAAEYTRLLYVAATRARSALVMTRFVTQKGATAASYWKPLLDCTDTGMNLGVPSSVSKGYDAGFQEACLKPDALELERALDELNARKAELTSETYSIGAAKEIALGDGLHDDGGRVAGSEHGLAKGSAVHQVLQDMAGNDLLGVREAAARACAEQGLKPEDLSAVMVSASKVVESSLWKRIEKSRRKLVEVPFVVSGPCIGMDTVDVIRGVIDLAFEEEDGWVVVDYKTDAIESPEAKKALIMHYGPQVELYGRVLKEAFGLNVKQSVLFFTESDEPLVYVESTQV